MNYGSSTSLRQKILARERSRWIDAVTGDRSLTASEKLVGIRMIKMHLNAKEVAAWPRYATLSGALALSEKTVQRAVKKLAKLGYFEIQVRGRSNYYVFTSIRKELEIAAKSGVESGRPRPPNRTSTSSDSGHRSPATLYKESKKEPCHGPQPPRCGTSRFSPSSANAREWNAALARRGLDSLECSKVLERSHDGEAYVMPWNWPPKDESEWRTVGKFLEWRASLRSD